MAILPIVEVPDPRLRQISSPVGDVNNEVRALIKDMFETMYDAPGIGLAAIQVGVPIRVLVMDLHEPEEEGGEPVNDPRVFINPEILTHSDEEVPYLEGCLSVPDQYAEVERPDHIRARWLDENGKQHEEQLDGLIAVCLQQVFSSSTICRGSNARWCSRDSPRCEKSGAKERPSAGRR